MKPERFLHRFTPNQDANFDGVLELRVYDPKQKEFVLVREIPGNKPSSFHLPGEKFNNPLQYRYRARNEKGDWVPITNYQPVRSISITDALNRLSDFNAAEPPIHLLGEANSSELKYLARNLLVRFYDYVLNAPTIDKATRYSQYLHKFPQYLLDAHFQIAYFHSLSYTISRAVAEYLIRGSEFHPEEFARFLFDDYRRERPQSVNPGSQAGLHVAAGHLMGVKHRDKAFQHYQTALEYGTDKLDLFLLVDGITTYFNSVPKTSSPLVSSIAGNRRSTSRRTICIAADERYWRAYATQWAHYSELFGSINFEFSVICQARHTAESFAESFGTLKQAIARSIKKGQEENVHISAVVVNNESKTFYACARFFVAQDLLLRTKSDVLCLDVDQYVLGDLDDFFQKAQASVDAVALQQGKDLYRYLPGRSHLAGYVFFKNNALSDKFLEDVISYVNHGLKQPNNWMLDQNALRFAAEKSGFTPLAIDRTRTFSHSNQIRLKAKRVVDRTS